MKRRFSAFVLSLLLLLTLAACGGEPGFAPEVSNDAIWSVVPDGSGVVSLPVQEPEDGNLPDEGQNAPDGKLHRGPGGAVPGGGVRPNVEAHDNGVGGRGQHHVGLADSSHAAVNNLDHNFFVGQFYETLFNCFHGTLYVCFHNDIQLFDIAGLDL